MSDLKTILTSLWDATVATLGNIQYETFVEEGAIGYGICIEETMLNYSPAGFTYQQTNEFGGDNYELVVCGKKSEVMAQVAAIAKVAATYTGDSDYSRIYPALDRMTWDTWKDSFNKQPHYRCVRIGILCSKNNKNLYS